MAKHFPGHKTEEYRRMLGKFGVSGDLALQQVIISIPKNVTDWYNLKLNQELQPVNIEISFRLSLDLQFIWRSKITSGLRGTLRTQSKLFDSR